MPEESRLDEFRSEAERLLADTVAVVPEELIAERAFSESEPRFGPTEGAPTPADPAWWQAREDLNLIAETDASARAFDAVSGHLSAEGWTQSRVREVDGWVTDGFRQELDSGDWYIEVTWVPSAPGLAEILGVLVVSPQTVRGDHDAPT
ncbi:hypothetical protein [Microbacterium sp. CPCC 204701]|uniref:hypothetical protein n=1 Tax=Microbacterium sp. CPCC 204701 TaxID=2493084 RepID=UPI000FD92144|nr:hypothetical protein [Microbacterium sp. CPCC 204701]